MQQLFEMQFERAQVDAISNLGLAHLGDGVFSLLVRTWLCSQGNHTVKNLHRQSEIGRASCRERVCCAV